MPKLPLQSYEVEDMQIFLLGCISMTFVANEIKKKIIISFKSEKYNPFCVLSVYKHKSNHLLYWYSFVKKNLQQNLHIYL